MSSHPQEHHKSPRRALVELFMLVGIPTLIIYIVSKVWK